MGFFLINYWQRNDNQYYDVIGRFDDLIKLMALDIVCKWTSIGRLGNANYILSIAYEVNYFCGLWISPRATSFNQASNSGATGWYMDTLITMIHSNRLYNHKMTKHKKRAYWTVTLNMCVRTIMKTHMVELTTYRYLCITCLKTGCGVDAIIEKLVTHKGLTI